jgi:hypothetical protein
MKKKKKEALRGLFGLGLMILGIMVLLYNRLNGVNMFSFTLGIIMIIFSFILLWKQIDYLTTRIGPPRNSGG